MHLWSNAMAERKKCNSIDERRTPQYGRVNQKYHYWTLQEKGWFRLVVIEPSLDPQHQISCSLIHQRIKDCAEYEALSYTWGTDMPKTPILIDGGVTFVRSSLYAALKNLRLEKKARIIWIDALSINQNDISERNFQVSQMTEIYSCARQVIVWLGESDKYTNLGIDFLAEISPQAKLIVERATESKDKMYEEWNNLFGSSYTGNGSEGWLVGVLALLIRDWWDRVWTVQEITLAQDAIIQAGQKSVRWEYLEIFSMVFSTYVNRSDQIKRTASSFQTFSKMMPLVLRADTIRIMRGRWRNKIEIPMSFMVEHTLSRCATDPKDKIYAIQGLINCGPSLAPNYLLSCEEIYTTAFKDMLEYFGDLRVYNYLQEIHPDRNTRLPTWVPDFTASKLQAMAFIGGASPNDPIDSTSFGPLYSAASERQGELIKARMMFQENGSVLVLHGIFVDKITLMGKTAPKAPGIKNTITEWRSLAPTDNRSYVTGGSVSEAFWRTVTLDCKIVNYHAGISLEDNPRDRRRRLDLIDGIIPPRTIESEEALITALVGQYNFGEMAQYGRRFFNTEKGYMGIGPSKINKGDVVCVLLGGETPYILRPTENGQYKMVGQW